MNDLGSLHPCLLKLCALQHCAFDKLNLQEACYQQNITASPKDKLCGVLRALGLKKPRQIKHADPSITPALIFDQSGQWGVVLGQNAALHWVVHWWAEDEHQWNEQALPYLDQYLLFKVDMKAVFSSSTSPVYQLIFSEFFSHKKVLFNIILGAIVINLVALGSSFYTMQVYDRVVPTGSTQTLYVLSIGVTLAILYELLAKKVRSKLFDKLSDTVDKRLARSIYLRFLAIRIDQLPQSVGGLASQMRGYETVRSFLTGVTTQLLVDAPFALLFGTVIYAIAGSLALIPLTFFFISLSIGLFYKKQVMHLAQQTTAAVNFKTGLLVETVEGAETIKAGQGGWRMLSRWMNTTDEARSYELKMRRISEHSQHLVSSFQQLSYILMVASGALLITNAQLTMGGLIACSILSGRILAPVATIPNHLMQWAHAKAALQGLDSLWELEDDHHGVVQPVVLNHIKGGYQLRDVEVSYGESPALCIANLSIKPGEKIAILGPVGAGKTSLLRLLAGLYKPQQGRILLDDVDLAHIAKPNLAEAVGYVQQEASLFSGTLRDNLILGMIDPGDEAILAAAKISGLLNSVITPNPQGLQQPIFEGGTGLSGGQKQLVHLTRAFLLKPNIWLLDEPTAAMDRNLEVHIIQSLYQHIRPEDTLMLVTHKPEMLDLVDRIIVIANQKIVMDGPKLQVIDKLKHSTSVANNVANISRSIKVT